MDHAETCSQCPHCTSLSQMCVEELIFSCEILSRSVPYLPVTIHSRLFTEACLMLPRYGRGIKNSVIALLSTWPKENLNIQELLPDKHLRVALNTGNHPSLLSVIIEGLLNLHACCKLRVVDFTGVYASMLFELPLLSLPKEQRNSDAVLEEVQRNCRNFLGQDEEEDLQSVLSWKINELSEKSLENKLHVKGPITIRTELQLNLSDYMAIDTELLGLSVHKKSPFHMNIVRIAVDNYHHRQVQHFRGFFNIIDAQVVEKLVIYGKRRGINLVMWDMAEQLDQLQNLKSFGLGTSGPKFRNMSSDDKPSIHEVFTRASVSFSKWTSLTEVYFIGIVLQKQISTILGALVSPLINIILYGCDLHSEDIEYLSKSHHVPHLEQLGLEYNNLCNLGDLLCDLMGKATSLSMLNLKETKLLLSEKIALMESLQFSKTLETLVLYEKEDMLSTEGYETILELACLIGCLKEFYIFPFDYKPFEMFCRVTMEEISREILFVNERTNLVLFY